ncbi:AEC family transporter [Salirhabdus salicampi]|uniref:AEC family transporter n=1 Tax=Salirhabdus salicampi TaxID=476102 RepID=UPI00266D28D8|nr:AEC family transporter [Salirhabdus salicampi]
MIFLQVVLPVFLVYGAGYLLRKKMPVDIKSVATVALYVMLPCLVFESFYTTTLDLQYVNILIFSFLLFFSIILVNLITARFVAKTERMKNGLILATAFMNSGNYGLPIILFAFGDAGMRYAIPYFVLTTIIMNIFGVYYAAKGKSSIAGAMKTVCKMPPTYALILGLSMNLASINLHDNIYQVIQFVSNAAVPTVMIVLGLQLAEITIKHIQWSKVLYGTIIRLLISPLLAFAILQLLPTNSLLDKVLIVIAAMPTAAITTMYAVEFDTEPEVVSSITLFTTVISALTISVLLYLLGV